VAKSGASAKPRSPSSIVVARTPSTVAHTVPWSSVEPSVVRYAEKTRISAVPGVAPAVCPISWTVAKSRPSGATAIAEIGNGVWATATARNPSVSSTARAVRGAVAPASTRTSASDETGKRRTIVVPQAIIAVNGGTVGM
jgi:hypothetical protein